jgi:hypothetical protein
LPRSTWSWPPEHDGLAGDNVLSIVGAPNRLTPEKLLPTGLSSRLRSMRCRIRASPW